MPNEQGSRIVTDEFGESYTLVDVIGSGGQGTVWEVNDDSSIVVKTLTDGETGDIVCDEETYDAYSKKIKSLIALSILEDIQNISVPIAMLERPMCGYVMLFMKGMEQISRHRPKNENNCISKAGSNASLKKKYKVMRNIADTVRKLHNSGLIYGDFSANNVFVSKDCDDYEAWLIDADNLTYAQKNKNCISTFGYGAPEVYAGHRNTIYSDIFSVAVVWFEYLTGSKPYIHKAPDGTENDEDSFVSFSAPETPEENNEVYMYEEDGLEKNGIPAEYVFTDRIYELFMKTFSKSGRENPYSRPSANEWYEAFNDAIDEITKCSNKHYHLSEKCLWCAEEECEDDKNKYFSVEIEAIPDFGERIDDDWCNKEIVSCYQPYAHKKINLYVEQTNSKNQAKDKEFQNISIFKEIFENVENLRAQISFDEKNVKFELCKGRAVEYKVTWDYNAHREQTFYISGLKRNYIISFCWGK